MTATPETPATEPARNRKIGCLVLQLSVPFSGAALWLLLVNLPGLGRAAIRAGALLVATFAGMSPVDRLTCAGILLALYLNRRTPGPRRTR